MTKKGFQRSLMFAPNAGVAQAIAGGLKFNAAAANSKADSYYRKTLSVPGFRIGVSR
jgi:hypothetical protein